MAINGYIIVRSSLPALGPFPDYAAAYAYAEKHCSDVDTVIEPLHTPLTRSETGARL